MPRELIRGLHPPESGADVLKTTVLTSRRLILCNYLKNQWITVHSASLYHDLPLFQRAGIPFNTFRNQLQ